MRAKAMSLSHADICYRSGTMNVKMWLGCLVGTQDHVKGRLACFSNVIGLKTIIDLKCHWSKNLFFCCRIYVGLYHTEAAEWLLNATQNSGGSPCLLASLEGKKIEIRTGFLLFAFRIVGKGLFTLLFLCF